MQQSNLRLIGLGLLCAAICGGRSGLAEEPGAKAQFFGAGQLALLVSHPVDGAAYDLFLSGPGSTVWMTRRDKDGQAEVHKTQNDIYVVESGHAKITVGGQVTGNREIGPGEYLGGEISGGTEYALAAGDVLFIPAGVPHKVSVAPNATISYVIVKTPKQPPAAAGA